MSPHDRFDEPVALGSLRGRASRVVSDDGTVLHVEVDEPRVDGAAGGEHDGDAGTPAPPLSVVFVHGYALNQDCWHGQREAFRGRFRSVFYDQRSHGRSDRSAPGSATLEQLGRDLMAVLEATAPGPVVLVGHSMGGMSILSLAEQRPELFGGRIVGVALISSSAGGLEPGRVVFPLLPRRVGSGLLSRAVRTLDHGNRIVDRARATSRGFADLVMDRFAFGPAPDPALVGFVFDMLEATPFSVVAEFYPSLVAFDSYEHLDVLERCPTVVICGTFDKITSISHSRELHARIAGSTLLECQGAGHMVILERRREVNAEIAGLVELAQMKLEETK